VNLFASTDEALAGRPAEIHLHRIAGEMGEDRVYRALVPIVGFQRPHRLEWQLADGTPCDPPAMLREAWALLSQWIEQNSPSLKDFSQREGVQPDGIHATWLEGPDSKKWHGGPISRSRL
jgi:hypothetical protein